MAKKILVVDDSGFQKRMMKRGLNGAGYEVLEAVDGKDGLKVLTENVADTGLVISDFNMPEMNGLEFLKAAKANPALAAVPVILATTESEKEMINNVLAAGACDYIVKPCETDDLVAKVKKHYLA